MPRPFRYARRFLAIALSAFAGLAAAGAVYQSVSARRDAARFPPPGRLVRVDGRRLHLLCIGQGEPTVVFEASGFGSSLSAEAVRTEIGKETRVCSYDRMGTGWSDAGPDTITIGMLANDLHELLDRAGVRPPSILVPASIGGLTVELFARRHPQRVAGLIFLDAASSALLERASDVSWWQVQAVCLARVAARLGLLRALDPFGVRQLPPETAARAEALMYRTERMDTACALARGIRTSVQELREAPPLAPDLPLVVLIAETTDGLFPPGLGSAARALVADRVDSQKRLSRRSSRGSWRMVPHSAHLIATSQPHVVSAAVLRMVAETRRDENGHQLKQP